MTYQAYIAIAGGPMDKLDEPQLTLADANWLIKEAVAEWPQGTIVDWYVETLDETV